MHQSRESDSHAPGLYVRFPEPSGRPSDDERVRAGLIREILLRAEAYRGARSVDALYLDGLPQGQDERMLPGVLAAVEHGFGLESGYECTLRTTPGAFDVARLRFWRAEGVNRLSLRVESLFDEDLQRLGVRFDEQTARRALDLIRAAGFDDWSVDLMLGLPGQPLEYWGASLQRVVGLDAPHLYLHEPDEADLAAVDPSAPLIDADERADRYELAVDLLGRAGLEPYEISYFARPGHRCRYVQKTWSHVDVVGVGPGAHGFVWYGTSRADRWSNIHEVRPYLRRIEHGRLPDETNRRYALFDLADEYVALRLRTSDGLDLQTLETRYGVDLLAEKTDELAWLEREGLVRPILNGRVRLTDAGRLVCDAVTRRLVS